MVFLSGTMQCQSVCAISILPGVSVVIMSEWETHIVSNTMKSSRYLCKQIFSVCKKTTVKYWLNGVLLIPDNRGCQGSLQPELHTYCQAVWSHWSAVHHHYASETIKEMVLLTLRTWQVSCYDMYDLTYRTHKYT